MTDFRSRKETDQNYVINVTNQINKPITNRFGSPGLFNQQRKLSPNSSNSGVYFIGEMKKHGIYDAFNDINKFSEFFEALPKKDDDPSNSTLKTHEQSQSSNQFTESQSTQMMSSGVFMDSKDKMPL